MRAGPFVLGMLLSLGSGCVSMAGKTAGEATESILDESLQTLSRPESRKQIAGILASDEMRRATANITAGAVDGVILSLSSRESVASMTPELGLLAHEVARQVTLGIDAALAEVSTRPAPQTGIGTLLFEAERATTASVWALPAAVVVLFVALVTTVILFVRATARARRQREEAERRAEALGLLAGTLRDAERQPWGPELRELLRRRAEGAGGGRYLDEILLRQGAAPGGDGGLASRH